MRFRSAAWRCCLAALWVQVAGAQFAPVTGRQSVSASAGVAESGRLDETASPVRYTGRGADFSIAWARETAPFSLQTSIGGGVRDLSPLDRSIGSSERLSEGALAITLLRNLGAARMESPGFQLGGQFAGNVAVTEHSYPGGQLRSDYVFAAGSLGPAAAWRHALFGGQFAANLALPIVALVDHPYSDIRVQRTPVAFRLVSFTDYRAINGSLTFTNPVSRSLGIVYAYRIGVLHFDDDQPLRTVTQTLSVGVTQAIFGRAR